MPITAASVLPEPHVIQAGLGLALPQFASVDWQASLASTNQTLMTQVRLQDGAEGLAWPRLLGAHHQTAGRGRAGRPWKDQGGQALMFSCGFQTTLTLPQLSGLAPALGIASAQVVREHLSIAGGLSSARLGLNVANSVRVKWPNDLMLADAKLAGILVESVARQSRVHGATPYLYLVVGMGLNLSGSQALSAQLGRPVADLSNTGLKVDLVALVAALANAWQATLQTLAQEGFTPFVDRLKPIDYLQGKRVNVMQQEVVLKSGLAQGVTDQGALALRLDNGELESILVGDVSVRWQSTEEATNASGGP